MEERSTLYASALHALGLEEGLSDTLAREMRELGEILKACPDYPKLLDARSVKLEERLRLVDETLRGKVHEYVVSMVKLMVENGAAMELERCAEEFGSLYRKEKGILLAVVTSAAPLTEAQREALLQRLERVTGKKVELVTRVDSRLIAGLRVELEGKEFVLTAEDRLAAFGAAVAPGWKK